MRWLPNASFAATALLVSSVSAQTWSSCNPLHSSKFTNNIYANTLSLLTPPL